MRATPPRCAALVLAPLLSFLAGAALAVGEERRPNLVLVYTDDQRHDSLSATGNPYFETPALDQLAREGVVFERAYVTTSLCCPSRATLLSGKYPHVTGVVDNQPAHDFQERHRSYPELLQEAGYETAFIGKWHLPNPGAAPRPGFDHWVSFEDQGEYFDELMNVDGEIVQTRGANSDVLVGYATRFLARERGERPFHLILSLKECHTPHLPPRRHRGSLDGLRFELPESFGDDPASLPGRYTDMRITRRNRGATGNPEQYLKQVQRYWELVRTVDEVVGRVVAALEEASLLEDTAFAFTSDNGYLVGEHGLIQKGIGYEPSIRVPLVLRFPRLLPRGRRSAALALNVDLMPTFLELAGVAVPGDVQGRSLLPIALGRDVAEREDFFYLAPWFTARGAPAEIALAGGRWKYMRFREGGLEEALFDLASDPGERVNLATDPAHRPQLERARERLREHMRALDVPAAWWEPEPAPR